MSRSRFYSSLFVIASLATSSLAYATHKPPEFATHAVRLAMSNDKHVFCTHPPKLLDERQQEMCPMARELPQCEALVASCDRSKALTSKPKEEESPSLFRTPKLPKWLGDVAFVLVILAMAAVLALMFAPLVRAYLRSRRDRALSDVETKTPEKQALRDAPAAVVITDAERLLAVANDLRARGETKEALGTYLTASLRALDQRGLVRFAKHRTNGEYVRSCTDGAARAELAQVVHAVELAEFGGESPSDEAIARVAQKASMLVRAGIFAAMLLFVAPFASGCGSHAPTLKTEDPAGLELLQDVLTHQGFETSTLAGSLGSLPIPGDDDTAPLVIVDFANTTVDKEAIEHLQDWMEAGGVLLALAPREDDEIGARTRNAGADKVIITLKNPYNGEFLDYAGHVAAPRMLVAKANESDDPYLAPRRFGTIEARRYATSEPRGKGALVLVATDDLFVNVGIAYKDNAKAVAAIIENAFAATREGDAHTPVYVERSILIARPQSGMTPPSNPVSALSRAGLGIGMWHALAASLVLFLAFGIRHSRAKPEAPPTRRAFAEHIEATGGLYARARAAAHARALFARFAGERIRAKTARNLGADDDAIARATGVDANQFRDLTTSANGNESQELGKLRTLRRMLAHVSSHDKPSISLPKDPS